MLKMGSRSLHVILRLLASLLSLLVHTDPLLAFSLKSCSIGYLENPSADVSLDCSYHGLVSVPDELPRDAVTVELHNNLLEKINREDFGDLPKLSILTLDDNKIAHVDDGSFIHLVALKKLSMRTNKLTNLTERLFQGLSNLTMLDLSSNHIQFIHVMAFHHLTSLQSVSLDSNMLLQITDLQPILQLPHIQNLSIGSNLFSSFQTKDLQLNVSSGLKVLDLSSNNLIEFSITTPVFPHLHTIDLHDNSGLTWEIPDKTLLRNITQLHLSFHLTSFEKFQKILQSLDSLMHLRLSHINVWSKKGLLSVVCKIPTLRGLGLRNNNLTNSTAKLVSCSQLTELDLSSTHVTELPKGSLNSMKQLRYLTLDTNMLTKVPYDIRSLSSLEILYLNDNLISELGCEDFVNTTRLSELYLKSNRILKLGGSVFKNLNDLKILDLSYNLLFELGGTFTNVLPKLQFLDLRNNFLRSLEKRYFRGLQSLKYLNVFTDEIERVKSGVFEGLDNLESLTVSIPLEYENNFRKVKHLQNLTIYINADRIFKSSHPTHYEASFHLKDMKCLTVICTGYHYGFPFDVPSEIMNAMINLENFTAVNVYISAPEASIFQFNPQLKSLTFQSTNLSDLDPRLFHCVPKLQILDLSRSSLRSLDFLMYANLFELRSLKLSENDLMIINETVFQFLPALTYLVLDENPFACDCSNAGFIQWVRSNKQTQVVNAYQYTCSFPEAQQGRLLLDFDTDSCFMDVGFLCFISSFSMVGLTLLTSFNYYFLKWQLVYTFQLFRAFLYDSRKRKMGAPCCYDAFVSYNIHDEDWVYREMLPVLEGEQGWRLCLHHRDFQPGKPIIENITDAIYSSRKTICVISRLYLQSEWCSREIQMANFRLFDEQKDVLILLFLEEIPARQLSPYYRMRKLVKKRTYLSWPQAGQQPEVFWENVRRALETGDKNAD